MVDAGAGGVALATPARHSAAAAADVVEAPAAALLVVGRIVVQVDDPLLGHAVLGHAVAGTADESVVGVGGGLGRGDRAGEGGEAGEGEERDEDGGGVHFGGWLF